MLNKVGVLRHPLVRAAVILIAAFSFGASLSAGPAVKEAAMLPEDPGRAGDITQEHSAAAVDVADKGRTEAYVARTRRSRRTAHAVVPPPTAPWP